MTGETIEFQSRIAARRGPHSGIVRAAVLVCLFARSRLFSTAQWLRERLRPPFAIDARERRVPLGQQEAVTADLVAWTILTCVTRSTIVLSVSRSS